jgi:hypothetical protein
MQAQTWEGKKSTSNSGLFRNRQKANAHIHKLT